MKNQILTLIFGTTMLAMSPIFAMEDPDDALAIKPPSTYKTAEEMRAEWEEIQKRVEAMPVHKHYKSLCDDTAKKPSIPVVTKYKTTEEILAEGEEIKKRVEAMPHYEDFKSLYDDTAKKPSIPVVIKYMTTEEILAERIATTRRFEVLLKQLETLSPSTSLPIDQTPSDSSLDRK